MFQWNDGVHIFTTQAYTPRVESVVEMPGQMVAMLDGSRLLVTQADSSGDPLVLDGVRLSWEWAPATLLPIVEETFRQCRQVTVTFPWRGGVRSLAGRIPPDGWQERPGERKMVRLEVTVLAQ